MRVGGGIPEHSDLGAAAHHRHLAAAKTEARAVSPKRLIAVGPIFDDCEYSVDRGLA